MNGKSSLKSLSLPNQFDCRAWYLQTNRGAERRRDTFGKFESPLQIDSYDGQQFSLGGVVLTNSMTRISDIPSGLDSALLEDRTPLVVKGMQVMPSASNRFKRSDNVVLYTEIYEPALVSETPPRVGSRITFMSALVTRTFSLADWRRRMISFGKEIR